MIEPKIKDVIKIIFATHGGDKEIIGYLEGYLKNDFGDYVKIKNQKPIFIHSIKNWQILT